MLSGTFTIPLACTEGRLRLLYGKIITCMSWRISSPVCMEINLGASPLESYLWGKQGRVIKLLMLMISLLHKTCSWRAVTNQHQPPLWFHWKPLWFSRHVQAVTADIYPSRCHAAEELVFGTVGKYEQEYHERYWPSLDASGAFGEAHGTVT